MKYGKNGLSLLCFQNSSQCVALGSRCSIRPKDTEPNFYHELEKADPALLR
jgi:hypothetical protein